MQQLKQLGKRIKKLHKKELDSLMNSYKNKGGTGDAAKVTSDKKEKAK